MVSYIHLRTTMHKWILVISIIKYINKINGNRYCNQHHGHCHHCHPHEKNKNLIDNGPCKWSHIHSSFAVPNISTEMGTECLQQRLEGSLQCKKTKTNLRPMITRCGKEHDSKQWGCPGKTVTSTVYSILYHWIYIYISIPSLRIMFWKVSQMEWTPLTSPMQWSRWWCTLPTSR